MYYLLHHLGGGHLNPRPLPPPSVDGIQRTRSDFQDTRSTVPLMSCAIGNGPTRVKKSL